MDAVKFKSKIIKYIHHGIDDRIILLEMIKATGDEQFINECERLINLQKPVNELNDLQGRFDRIANKIDAIDEHLKANENQDVLLDLANKHYSTLKKIEAEIVKHGTGGSRAAR